ncbi:double-stranded RNA binding motif domain-containing protein [Myxococcus faecalis]|jgi:alcohol dehydrogenase YqhD (iron-dependent ADH family)|uniref:double-stranded RNA binding motif domain-containing protein n=1 Tax=Myxococcus faecalis TaxID=3115646 RepID=UPI003CEA68B4
MSCSAHFSSISARGPLGHVVTLRATGAEVEAHAATRGEAMDDARAALVGELRRARTPRTFILGRRPVRRRM